MVPRVRAQPRPALVVWGTRDRYLPRRMAEDQRDLFGAGPVVGLEGAGHWSLVERPDAVAAAVVPFLRSVHVQDDLAATH